MSILIKFNAWDELSSLNRLGLMSVKLDSILRLRTYSLVRMARADAHARTYHSRQLLTLAHACARDNPTAQTRTPAVARVHTSTRSNAQARTHKRIRAHVHTSLPTHARACTRHSRTHTHAPRTHTHTRTNPQRSSSSSHQKSFHYD